MPPDAAEAFLVRHATPEDADELAALRWQWSNEGRTPTIERGVFVTQMASAVRGYVDSGRWTIWIAADAATGRIVGHAYLQRIEKVPRPYPRPPAWGYVTNVYVLPEYRNSGIGRRILDALITETRDAGVDTLLLWPSERATPFYRRAGFVAPPRALELALDQDG